MITSEFLASFEPLITAVALSARRALPAVAPATPFPESVQTGRIAAWEALRTFNSDRGELGGWIARHVRSAVIRELLTNARPVGVFANHSGYASAPRPQFVPVSALSVEAAPGDTPEQALERRDAVDCVRVAIRRARLTRRTRRANPWAVDATLVALEEGNRSTGAAEWRVTVGTIRATERWLLPDLRERLERMGAV